MALRNFRLTLEVGSSELGKAPRHFSVERVHHGFSETTNLHWMKFGVWRFALGQFNCGYTQTPNIGLVIIPALFDHFRGHPVRRPDKGILLS